MGTAGKGRPAKPTALKVLHGDRSDRVNKSEPKPATTGLEPPGWLQAAHKATPAAEESALDVWNRMAPDLIKQLVLTAWDIEAFAVYCDAVVRFRQATLEVAQVGMTIRGDRGTVKNPAVTAAKDYADLMQRFGARFGLTPSDRASITVKGGESDGKTAGRLLS